MITDSQKQRIEDDVIKIVHRSSSLMQDVASISKLIEDLSRELADKEHADLLADRDYWKALAEKADCLIRKTDEDTFIDQDAYHEYLALKTKSKQS